MRSSTLSIAFVALIALIAVCDARVEAKRDCTPQTCAGPVTAYFDGTTCSGPAKQYYALVPSYSGTDNGPCEVRESVKGHRYTISATSVKEESFLPTGGVNGSLCASNNLAWYDEYTFGICQGDTKDNSSFIYLRSVDETFTPGPVASPSTAPSNPYINSFDCYSITNCTNTVDASILPMYGTAYFSTSNGDSECHQIYWTCMPYRFIFAGKTEKKFLGKIVVSTILVREGPTTIIEDDNCGLYSRLHPGV